MSVSSSFSRRLPLSRSRIFAAMRLRKSSCPLSGVIGDGASGSADSSGEQRMGTHHAGRANFFELYRVGCVRGTSGTRSAAVAPSPMTQSREGGREGGSLDGTVVREELEGNEGRDAGVAI
eukprot:gene13183-biopygen7995